MKLQAIIYTFHHSMLWCGELLVNIKSTCVWESWFEYFISCFNIRKLNIFTQ